jgi:hypothetical protein
MVLDSFQVTTAHNAAETGRLNRRLLAIEERARRSTTGVRHTELVQLRRWITRAEQRAIGNADKIVDLGRRMERLERLPQPTGGDPTGS